MDPEARLGDLGEKAILKHIRSRIPLGPGVALGVGDDAAAVETGALTLVTTDALVEGVHFRRTWTSPRLLGRKALSVNLSDIGAMGGVPRFVTVSLMLPLEVKLEFVDGLYDGLLERAAWAGVSLIGGNLARTEGPIVIDLTVLGHADKLITRAGAQPGDLLVVSGSLGAAAAGVKLLAQGARLTEDGDLRDTGMWTESSGPLLLRCLRAQLDPSPPLAFARALAENDVVHAAMDISDGLSGDTLQLCQESGVGAWLDPINLPIDRAAAALERARGADALDLALHGGEDYELLMAVAPDRLDALKDVAVVWDVPLTVVGQVVAGAPEVKLRSGGVRLPCPMNAHDHFRAARPGTAEGGPTEGSPGA
jgi:thiamine-monophosphate kinase